MGQYVLRRLLHMIAVLLGASLVLFVCLYVFTDPEASLGGLGENPKARDPAVVAELEKEYGLDRPLPEQYLRYVGHLARGDLGRSYRLDRPVTEILAPKAVTTLRLALAAMVVLVALGFAAGLISTVSRYSFWDVAVTLTTTVAIGVPTFVTGLVLQDLFAFRLRWFPLPELEGGLRSLVLPAVTLGAVDAAVIARLLRGTMLETLRADYIRTALAKGLRRSTVTLRHGLRNSIIPVVTYVGLAFGGLIGGALITESIFNIDGLGSAMVTAIASRDHPVVLAIVVYGIAVFVLVNLVVDIAYAWLDPRIRLDRP